MIVFELGVAGAGIDGDTEATGPGAGGVGPLAVWLSEPGRTIGLESWILGFVFRSSTFLSANGLWRILLAERSTVHA